MSEPVTKRRPMIDLEEFERRLRQARSSSQEDGESIAELARLVGWQDNSSDGAFKPQGQHLAEPRQDTLACSEHEHIEPEMRLSSARPDFAAIDAGPPAAAPLPEGDDRADETAKAERTAFRVQGRLIGGDFAAIEAGLLGVSQNEAATKLARSQESSAVSSETAEAEHLNRDYAVSVRCGDIADNHKRPRRPLYAATAIIIVAIAGIAASSGLQSVVSSAPDVTTIKSPIVSTKLKIDAAGRAEVLNEDSAAKNLAAEALATQDDATQSNFAAQHISQDTASVNETRELPPVALNGAEQQAGGPQSQETSPVMNLVGSAPRLDGELAAETASVAPPPTQANPLGNAAPIEPKKTGAIPVPPNRASVNKIAPARAMTTVAPLPTPRPSVAAKASTRQTARVEMKQIPAAGELSGRAHLAPDAKAKPVADRALAKAVAADPGATQAVAVKNVEPAQIADAKTATMPATNPGLGSNGALGAVQNAVNSLTSSTVKLLGWGAN
jgi:hypothetical protein